MPELTSHIENRRTCLVYSPGGHFAEIERALAGITFNNAYHVTFANGLKRDNTLFATEELGSAYGAKRPANNESAGCTPIERNNKDIPTADKNQLLTCGGYTYYITHPRRSIVRTIMNAFKAFAVLRKERPAIIISTGADVAIPTIILGKMIFKAKVIYIESAGDIAPSLSGKLAYPFADLFIVQWPEKLKRFPKAILSDGVLL